MEPPAVGATPPYEDAFDASLFVDEDYSGRVVVGGVELAASEAACTAHDLTGQVVWPAAGLLADHLLTDAGRRTVAAAGGAALELGAGAGVAGAAAAAAGAATLLLTDHNDVVLRLLTANAARVAAATGAAVATRVLEWASAADRAAARAAAPTPDGWPLVIGADVAYSVNALGPLTATIAALLAPAGVALIGYVSRSGLLDRGLPRAAADAGLTAVEVPGTRRGVGGGLEGWIVRMERREA